LVVHDPENPSCPPIGVLFHDLIDEAVKGCNSGFGFAATEKFGLVDIQGGQIGPGSQTAVFVFDLHRLIRLWGQRFCFSAPRLHAGLLVGRQDELIWAEFTALPETLVQIQDASGLGFEIRGARGKIQQRCCPGWIASSLSQRQRVVSLREAVSPQERTGAPSSATLQRERGAPTRRGNSQAIALTCTTSSGGKNPGPARAFGVLQPGQSFFEEPFSPTADDLASRAEAVGDLIIGEALLSEENHFGAGDHKIR
jgi:hypothetical protein